MNRVTEFTLYLGMKIQHLYCGQIGEILEITNTHVRVKIKRATVVYTKNSIFMGWKPVIENKENTNMKISNNPVIADKILLADALVDYFKAADAPAGTGAFDNRVKAWNRVDSLAYKIIENTTPAVSSEDWKPNTVLTPVQTTLAYFVARNYPQHIDRLDELGKKVANRANAKTSLQRLYVPASKNERKHGAEHVRLYPSAWLSNLLPKLL